MARAALDADPTAVPLDAILADEETEAQPNARRALALHARHTVEAPPDACLLLRGDTRPLIVYSHARLPVFHAQHLVAAENVHRSSVTCRVRELAGPLA